MNKEEILSRQLDRYLLKISDIERGCTPIPVSIYRAMDEYANNVALAFASYLNGPDFPYSTLWNGETYADNNGDEITIKELFDHFIKHVYPTQQTKDK